MDVKEILKHVDHTLLLQGATWEEIQQICDDGIKYQTASVCIPPCYVKLASEYAVGKMRICTVIGFPNGYNTTEVKAFEAKQALLDGADEIDIVISIGKFLSGQPMIDLDHLFFDEGQCGITAAEAEQSYLQKA